MNNHQFFYDRSAGQAVKAWDRVMLFNPGWTRATSEPVRGMARVPAIEGETTLRVASPG
jgi:hypothetical protein